LGANSRQENLLSGTDTRIGQINAGANEAPRRTKADAFVALIKFCPKSAQSIEVEVDGAVTNPTTAKVRNEGFAQLVKERATEKNRNPARAGVGINLSEVRALDPAGVKLKHAVTRIGDGHRVSFKEAPNDGDITDDGHVLQNAR
jgi:hypothetical protein